LGKANETTPEIQAENEAVAEWKHKLDHKYVDSLDKVGVVRKIEVMLAPNEKFIDTLKPKKSTNKYAQYPADVQPKLDGCLAYDTQLEFEDGRQLSIGYVVENNITGRVKSFDIEHGCIVYSDISGWMKNDQSLDVGTIVKSEPQGEWYDIELADGRMLTVTGNHLIFLPLTQCWKRVDELTGNEVLLLDSV